MLTKNSMSTIKEYPVPCFNAKTGAYRTFTIMARSLKLVEKIINEKFQDWKVQRPPFDEKMNVSFDRRLPFQDAPQQQCVDMRVVRKMNPSFDEDVKLNKMLDKWLQ